MAGANASADRFRPHAELSRFEWFPMQIDNYANTVESPTCAFKGSMWFQPILSVFCQFEKYLKFDCLKSRIIYMLTKSIVFYWYI